MPLHHKILKRAIKKVFQFDRMDLQNFKAILGSCQFIINNIKAYFRSPYVVIRAQ
jgi:hypothetical protein